MKENSKQSNGFSYYFDDVVIERGNFRVLKGGQPKALTPRSFDVLIYLIEQRGSVVEKQELFEQIWKETFVTDNALMRAVKDIRRELGDDAGAPRYIETVHKRGYRFIAQLKDAPNEDLEFETEAERSESPKLSEGETVTTSSRQATVETANQPTTQTDAGTSPETTSSIKNLVAKIKESKASAVFALVALVIAVASIIYLGRGEKAIHSLAVLPLESANADTNTEYMSDGITESLINSLSQLPDLKVIARTTSFRYKGQQIDAQKVGRDLHVDAVLTGRVIQQGENLIIQAELINAADGSQLWGKRFSRRLADIFSLQEEIAKEISEKLQLKLTGEDEKRLAKRYTENTEAYRLYLTGRYFWSKRTTEGLNKSIAYYQQAIYKDPNYALAYAGLADSYAALAINTDALPRESFPQAKAAAVKALELDDTLVEAHATMLQIKAEYDWDWSGVEREYRRAVELNPNYPMTHLYYSIYLIKTGRHEEAVAEIKRAQELDPFSLIINAVVGRVFFFARRYDEAIEACYKTLELDPNFFVAHLFLGRAYKEKRMYEQAVAELSSARDAARDLSETTSLLGYVYAVSGKRDEAKKILNEMKEMSKHRYVPPYNIAMVYAGLGEKDQAFEWLEKAYEDRNQQFTLLNIAPEFDSLRSDPRFTGLLRRIG